MRERSLVVKYLIILLSGLLMFSLSGCGENKNSREWIENKVSEVSRVYPTENLFDLFEEFPEGFEIYQVYITENLIIDIKFLGSSKTQTINGTITVTDLKTDEIIRTSELQYIDGKYIGEFTDWRFTCFLFEKFIITGQKLSESKLLDYHYDSVANTFDISYRLRDSTLNNYFNKNSEAIVRIGSSISNSTNGIYRYSVTVDFENGHYFRETVANYTGGGQ